MTKQRNYTWSLAYVWRRRSAFYSAYSLAIRFIVQLVKIENMAKVREQQWNENKNYSSQTEQWLSKQCSSSNKIIILPYWANMSLKIIINSQIISMRDIDDDCTCAKPFSLSHTNNSQWYLDIYIECANNNATIILLAHVHDLFYLFSLGRQINI